MNECLSIDCIFNEKLRKGICIGVSDHTRSYSKDVIRMCLVEKKPSLQAKCETKTQAQMTPAEAVGIGVALIRASIIGESLLKTKEMGDKKDEAKTKA